MQHHKQVKQVSFREYNLDFSGGIATFSRPSVHQLMLEDGYRTLSFRNALLELLSSREDDATVLDIGTGTGILSYFAASLGAKVTYAVEASSLAEVILPSIVAANALCDKVKILKGLSYDIGLPTKADLLVCEILGHLGFDEGILDVAYDARQRLLVPNASIIPNRIRLVAVPVCVPEFEQKLAFWGSGPYGYSFAPMRELVQRQIYLASMIETERWRASPQPILDRVVGDPFVDPITGQAQFEMRAEAEIHGMSVWFEAQLTETITLVSRDCTSWCEVFFPFPRTLQLRAGQKLRFCMRLDKRSDTHVDASWGVDVDDDASMNFLIRAHDR